MKRKTPVIAAVLHELLKAESFDTIPDLKEALKCRCATLRIPYERNLISEALDLVERTRQVVHEKPQSQRRQSRIQGETDSRGLWLPRPQGRRESGFVRLGGAWTAGPQVYPGEVQRLVLRGGTGTDEAGVCCGHVQQR